MSREDVVDCLYSAMSPVEWKTAALVISEIKAKLPADDADNPRIEPRIITAIIEGRQTGRIEMRERKDLPKTLGNPRGVVVEYRLVSKE